MSTDNIFAWSGTPGSNTDVAGNGIQGSSNLSLGNDVFQNIMAQLANGAILRGTDIATAATLDFTAVGVTNKSLIHDLTGVVTVTAVTLTASQWRLCRATGVFQFTASATLVVNGSTSVNYTTTAGDLIVIFGYGSSTVRVWTFSGGATVIPSATTSVTGTVQLSYFGIAQNVGIEATVAANALTITLTDAAGATPSASSPVIIPFRNATLTTGTTIFRTQTAAASLVVASTKTLGTVSGQAARLWVVAVDTGSGIEIGVVNCLSGTNIMALSGDLLYSPTATPANSAQVIYTTSGQTSKPICVLGYIEITEATAGTWATAPSKKQIRRPDTKLPGDMVQTVRTQTGAVATGSTVIPIDDTIPQNTEGDQFMSLAITPSSAANILSVSASVVLANTGVNIISACLFQDSTANTFAATTGTEFAANNTSTVPVTGMLIAGTSSATTIKLRGGGNAGTTTFNGGSGSRLYGGSYSSFIKIDEIMA